MKFTKFISQECSCEEQLAQVEGEPELAEDPFAGEMQQVQDQYEIVKGVEKVQSTLPPNKSIITPSQGKLVEIALEGLYNTYPNVKRGEIALEKGVVSSIAETIKDLWKKILEAVKKAFAAIKEFFITLFSRVEKLSKVSRDMNKIIDALPDDFNPEGKKIEDEALLSRLRTKYTSPEEGSNQVLKFVQLIDTSAQDNGVFEQLFKALDKFNENKDIIPVVEKLPIILKTKYIRLFDSSAKTTQPFMGDDRIDAHTHFIYSELFPGQVRFAAWIPKDTDHLDKLNFKVYQSENEGVDPDPKILTKRELRKMNQNVYLILETVKKQKKIDTNLSVISNKLDTVLRKAQIEHQELELVDRMFLSSLIKIIPTLVSGLYVDVFKYGTQYSKDALSYLNKSLKA